MLSETIDSHFLSILYQSLLIEGTKSKLGSYYTPDELVISSLNSLESFNSDENFCFFDPCCGTGQYLNNVVRQFPTVSLNQLIGFDIDDRALFIANISLCLLFNKECYELPLLFNLNILSSVQMNQSFTYSNINYIATNPPWGKNRDYRFEQYNGDVKSNELFAMMIEKSIELIDSFGHLSFILPESFLYVKDYS